MPKIKSTDHYSWALFITKLSLLKAYKKVSKFADSAYLKKTAWIFDHVLEFPCTNSAVWYFRAISSAAQGVLKFVRGVFEPTLGGLGCGDRKIVRNSKISNQNFIDRKTILFILLYTWFSFLPYPDSPSSSSPSKYSHIRFRSFTISFTSNTIRKSCAHAQENFSLNLTA